MAFAGTRRLEWDNEEEKIANIFQEIDEDLIAKFSAVHKALSQLQECVVQKARDSFHTTLKPLYASESAFSFSHGILQHTIKAQSPHQSCVKHSPQNMWHHLSRIRSTQGEPMHPHFTQLKPQIHFPKSLKINNMTEGPASESWVQTGFNRIQGNPLELEHSFSIGQQGKGEGEFETPSGIAIHPITGAIYVTDEYNHRIHVYSRNHKLQRTVTQPTGGHSFQRPRGIDVSLKSTIAVVEVKSKRIQLMTDQFVHLCTVLSDPIEKLFLNEPYYVAFDLDCNFYVTDYTLNGILMFKPDGTYVKSVTIGAGGGHGSGVMVDEDNMIYFVEYGGDLVQVLNGEGTVVGMMRINSDSGLRCLCRSSGGGFGVTSLERDSVAVYSKTGELIRELKVADPRGLCMDAQGTLYVCQGFKTNNQVAVFTSKPTISN